MWDCVKVKRTADRRHSCELGVSTPKSPRPVRDQGSCLIQCYFRPHECPCQMASHHCPTALAWCTSVQTARRRDRPCYGNTCRNRRNRFQRCRLKIMQRAGGKWGTTVERPCPSKIPAGAQCTRKHIGANMQLSVQLSSVSCSGSDSKLGLTMA